MYLESHQWSALIIIFIVLKAKLAARRQQQVLEAFQQMEDSTARRLVAEQVRRMSQGRNGTDGAAVDLHHKPTVVYTQSAEEQAMLHEHVCQSTFVCMFVCNSFVNIFVALK